MQVYRMRTEALHSKYFHSPQCSEAEEVSVFGKLAPKQ